MSDFRCAHCSVLLTGIDGRQWTLGSYCSDACQQSAMAVQLVPADAAWDRQPVTSGTAWDTQRLPDESSDTSVQPGSTEEQSHQAID